MTRTKPLCFVRVHHTDGKEDMVYCPTEHEANVFMKHAIEQYGTKNVNLLKYQKYPTYH